MDIDFHRCLQAQLANYNIGSFPKELLQNSDDAQCSHVAFVIDYVSNALWHFQSKALTANNFDSLGRFFKGSKENDHTKIGKFGLGFCSVFHVTDSPQVVSGGRGWRVELKDPYNKTLSPELPKMDHWPHDDNLNGAVFFFPLREKAFHGETGASFEKMSIDVLADKFRVLPPVSILFLRHVCNLQVVTISKKKEITFLTSISLPSPISPIRREYFECLTAGKNLNPKTEEFMVREGQKETITWFFSSLGMDEPKVVFSGAKVTIPLTVQMSSPSSLVRRGTLCCGLPLTGIASPLLCDANLELLLDSTRINILWGNKEQCDFNEQRLKRLSTYYVRHFLPFAGPLVVDKDEWPIVPVSQEGPIGFLSNDIIGKVLTGKDKIFPVLHSEPRRMVSMEECAFSFHLTKSLQQTYQVLADKHREITQMTLLGEKTFIILEKVSKSIIVIPKMDPSKFAGLLRHVSPTEFSECVTKLDDVLEVLEYLLADSKASKANITGIPLRWTYKGWSSFSPTSIVYCGDDAQLLLQHSGSDWCIHQSLNAIFTKNATVLTPLVASLKVAALTPVMFSQRLSAMDEAERMKFLKIFWAFVEKECVSKSQDSFCNDPSWLTLPFVVDRKNIILCLKNVHVAVPCDDPIDDFLEKLGIVLLNVMCRPLIGAARGLNGFSGGLASDPNFVVNLLVSFSSAGEKLLLMEKNAAIIRQYLVAHVALMSDPCLKLLKDLKVWKLLSGGVSTLQTGKDVLITNAALFDSFPEASHVLRISGIPLQLIGKIPLPTLNEYEVYAYLLKPEFWIPLEDDNKIALIQTIARNGGKLQELFASVLLPTHHGSWQPVSSIIHGSENTVIGEMLIDVAPEKLLSSNKKVQQIAAVEALQKHFAKFDGASLLAVINVARKRLMDANSEDADVDEAQTFKAVTCAYGEKPQLPVQYQPMWKIFKFVSQHFDKSVLALIKDAEFIPCVKQERINWQLPTASGDNTFVYIFSIQRMSSISFNTYLFETEDCYCCANILQDAKNDLIKCFPPISSFLLRLRTICSKDQSVISIDNRMVMVSHIYHSLDACVKEMKEGQIPANFLELLPASVPFVRLNHRNISMFVEPSSCMLGDDFDPFVPSFQVFARVHPWAGSYSVPQTLPPSVPLMLSGLSRLKGRSLSNTDINQLKNFLTYCGPSLMLLQKDASTYLPDESGEMVVSTQLAYIFDKAVLGKNFNPKGYKLLFPELTPKHFDFAHLSKLGVQNIRQLQKKVESTPSNTTFPKIQERLRHPMFASALSLLSKRIISVDALSKAQLICSKSLCIEWKNQQDVSNVLTALSLSDLQFFVVVESGGQEIPEEDVRQRITSLICEFFAFPATLQWHHVTNLLRTPPLSMKDYLATNGFITLSPEEKENSECEVSESAIMDNAAKRAAIAAAKKASEGS